MPTLVKPKQGEDVRMLHRNVRELVKGITILTDMTATWSDGEQVGVGRLSIKGDKSELKIVVQPPADKSRIPPTIVTLTSSVNPSHHGENVVFTASVPMPISGAITFYIDSVPYATVTLTPFNNGTVSAPGISTLETGDHIIAAQYIGNQPPGINYLTQQVGAKITPDMSLLVAPNPAGLHAQVEFLASLPTDATGIVIFYIDGFSIGGTSVVDGEALLLSTSGLLTSGTHTPSAFYNGDERYNEREVFGVSLVILTTIGVFVEVLSSNNPAATTERIAWAADVWADPSTPTILPTGTVQFYIDGNGFGPPATVVPQTGLGKSRALSLTTDAPNGLDPGEHEVSAEYSGDTHYAASVGQMTQMVLVVTDISVDCREDEPIVGVTTTLICHVPKVEGFAPPTGGVDFFVSGGYIDSGMLHPTNPPEPPGMQLTETSVFVFHSGGMIPIRAEYEGDGTYAGVFEEHSIQVFELATGFSFDWFGYITGGGETIAVAWYFNLLNPGDERSTPVEIRVIQALWSPYPNPIYIGGYPMEVHFNAGVWTPAGDPNTQVAEIFMTATGSGGVSGTNMQALLEVGFSDGHTAANLVGTPANTGLWLLSGPNRLILTASFR